MIAMMMNASAAQAHPKIAPPHLERQAMVYIRQSSPRQVRANLESQANQRALVDRALALGWHRERIQVLDADLGQSGATAEGREAFKALTAEIALGQVGIVFGWEVSRLARNNADWYHLLDLAALVGTLIADSEGVYDPRLYNDRLLLGLKGTMSEAELHLMRQRLDAGRLSKVVRGEYAQHLPTGLVRLADGRVVQDPDDQVRHTLGLVFTTFAELGSCQKTLRFLRRHDLTLPRRSIGGLQKGEVLWKKPSAAAIYEIISNPAYAGAFVYGRRPTDPRRRIPGRRATGVVRKPMEEWRHVQHDVYPAYISWEQYVANQAQLHDNAQRHDARSRPGRGAPRQGAALLQGLAVCGRCGHVMKTAYKRAVRYLCDGLSKEFAEPMCASLDGPSLEAVVVQSFLAALQPAQLDALEALLVQQRQERAQLERQWDARLQRAQYQAELARRRYEAVDPANRLVAAELERRWEEQLVALRQVQEAAARFQGETAAPSLSPEMREQLQHIAQVLPDWWNHGQITHEQQKLLLRSLIARVILKRTAPDQVEVKVVWVSGHVSVSVVAPPIHRQVDVSRYEEMVQRVQSLWEAGCTDRQIAERLSQEGFHAARSTTVSPATVLKLRNQRGWHSSLHRHRHAPMVDGQWTIHGLSQALGVDPSWFYRRIYDGRLRAPEVLRTPFSGNYLLPNDPALLQRLRSEIAGGRQPRSQRREQSHA